MLDMEVGKLALAVLALANKEVGGLVWGELEELVLANREEEQVVVEWEHMVDCNSLFGNMCLVVGS